MVLLQLWIISNLLVENDVSVRMCLNWVVFIQLIIEWSCSVTFEQSQHLMIVQSQLNILIFLSFLLLINILLIVLLDFRQLIFVIIFIGNCFLHYDIIFSNIYLLSISLSIYGV